MTARRGEVWLIDLGEPVGREQAGHRPALVASTDAFNDAGSGLAIVVPLTTTRRDLPLHIEIEPGSSGLDDVSYAKCEDIRSISERRLVTRLGSVGPEVLYGVGGVLRHLLEL